MTIHTFDTLLGRAAEQTLNLTRELLMRRDSTAHSCMFLSTLASSAQRPPATIDAPRLQRKVRCATRR